MQYNYTHYRSVLSLRTGQTKSAGRNAKGKITVRHRGGGHKQAFRLIDWTRASKKALVVGFEYDPKRNAPLAKLYHCSSGYTNSINSKSQQGNGKGNITLFKSPVNTNMSGYSYILAPAGIQLFQEVFTYGNSWPEVLASECRENPKNTSPGKLLQPGDSAAIALFETGDFIHAVEAFPGQGAIYGRAGGSFCQVRSIAGQSTSQSPSLGEQSNIGNGVQKEKEQSKRQFAQYAKVRLPSGSQHLIRFNARATYGVVGTSLPGSLQRGNLKKAGRARWLGWRPSVRGVAMNPVDHPHGGGQGKTSGGRPSVTFKSWPTKGQPTRSSKRKNQFILTPRFK